MATTKIKSTNIESGGIQHSNLVNSGATAGTYGAAASIPVLTVTEKGIITAVSTVAVAGVSNFTYSSGDETLTISTADGNTYEADISGLASETYVDTEVGNITSNDLDMGSNKILYSNVYSALVDLPSASSYHGMFAHVHATGKGYFAHAGSWVPLANESQLTGLATETYVDTAVSNLIDSSPSTLDTLNELAAALGDDPNFASTVSANIGTRALKTTTVSAGTGLTGGGDLSANRTINLANTSVVAGSYGSSTAIPVFTVDAQGRITAASNTSITVGDGTLTVSGSSGLTGSGTFTANQTTNGTITLSHADTSTQASVNNSNGTVIQDITLDGFGHITGIASANLDGRYFTETEANANFLGINAKAADADLFDGLNSTQFLRSDTDDISNGRLAIKTTQYSVGGNHELSLLNSMAIGPSNSDLVYFRYQGAAGEYAIQTYNSGNSGELHLQPYGGNVGIGTANPGAKLDVSGGLNVDGQVVVDGGTGVGSTGVLHVRQNGDGSGNGIAITSSQSTSHRIWKDANGKLNFGPSNIPSAFVQDLGGNVGMGVTNPATPLQIYQSTNAPAGDQKPTPVLTLSAHTNSDNEGPSIEFNSAWVNSGTYLATSINNGWGVAKIAGVYDDDQGNGGALTFYTNEGPSATSGATSSQLTEKLRIKPNGNVGIGDTTPSYKLDVNGTIRATGDVIADSDVRLKSDIQTLTNAVDTVKALRGTAYIKDNKASIGVIAQEVEEVLPQLVSTANDEMGTKSVSYGNMVAVLIEAIKEQQEQIDELKKLLEAK